MALCVGKVNKRKSTTQLQRQLHIKREINTKSYHISKKMLLTREDRLKEKNDDDDVITSATLIKRNS